MELDREQIKKELSLFIDDAPAELHLGYKATLKFLTFQRRVLEIIKSDEREIFELEKNLKECEIGYEGTLFLDRCKLHDAEEKIEKLSKEIKLLKEEREKYGSIDEST